MSSRADATDYAALFLRDTPMIDTRAPVEFSRGSFPGAVNLPLMSDEERARVGTCYKEQGQDAAIILGHQLVQGDIKAARVQAWLEFAERHPEGYLFCFRGGLRSQICQQWLAQAGCDYPRVGGGYKAMRRFLIDSMESICASGRFTLVAGRTGAAKTALLEHIAGSVDLEGRAHHRGSAFGRRVGGQPAQIDFENSIAIDLLRRAHEQPGRAIVLEDEGKFIGRCALPLALLAAMEQSPLVVVDATLEQRVEHSFKNYILDNLADWQALDGPEQGFANFANDLRESLGKLRRRLGGARHGELTDMLEQSLAAHACGDEEQHRGWITVLLRDYYDPMYTYQLEQKAERIVFRGSAHEVREYLQQ